MSEDKLWAHLKGGLTTLCRCWAVTRRDGVTMGFTDHDETLFFENIKFLANTGLSARAIEQTTGLAVDNSEALGALTDPAIRESDVRAGLFDGAEVKAWLVNWTDPDVRRMTFRGTFGELERSGNAFRAELRGLAETLNQPQGRVYQRACSAVLGDAKCGVDLAAFRADGVVTSVEDGLVLTVTLEAPADEGWFAKGQLLIAGKSALIKSDQGTELRRIVLWDAVKQLEPGSAIELIAGCDKRIATCREKFDNVLNFRGFPDIPGEDWLMSYPVSSSVNDGGSLRR